MKKLLIVVDYQNDFVTGPFGFPEAALLELPILKRIQAYEADAHHIIYTFDTHYDEHLKTKENQGNPIKDNLHKTEGHALYGKVLDHYQRSSYPHVKTLFKDTYGSRDLMLELTKREAYDVIELVGLVSYICVLSNAILAKTAQPEARIVVNSSCTAGPDPKLHEACLNLLRNALRVTVV